MRGGLDNINVGAVGLTLCATTLAAPAIYGATSQPNVVFIISDQHQKMATGCYGSPQKTVDNESPTPNIDELATAGVLFNNAYTPSPLSSPARGALTTGVYPFQTTSIRHKENNQEPGYVRYPGILDNLPCIAEIFRDAGYSTAAIGKMHVHGELSGVEDLGYDHVDLRFYTHYPGAQYEDHDDGDWHNRYREMTPYSTMLYSEIEVEDDPDRFAGVSPTLTVNSNGINQYFLETLVEKEEQMFDDMVAAASIEYITQCVEAQSPFYIHIGLEKPHNPYTSHKKFMDRFSPDQMVLSEQWNDVATVGVLPFLMDWIQKKSPVEANVRNTSAGYYACLNSMDEEVGNIVAACRELGIYDNTIFVYTTDHGEHLYKHSLIEKHCMFESATNVPLIISYPAKYDSGVKSDALCTTLDILPTILDLAGLDTPATFIGESLVDYSAVEGMDRYIFSEFYETDYVMFDAASALPMRMCRHGEYKYIYTHGLIEQLYNLATDPDEMNNLVLQGDTYRDIIDQLRFATLANWSVDIFPTFGVYSERTEDEIYFTPIY